MRDLVRFAFKRSILHAVHWYRRRNGPVNKIFCLPGDHIGDEIFIDGLYERQPLTFVFDELLAERREHFKNMVCFDIGANIGNHSLFFSRRFEFVYSFEPNPVFCSLFRATMEINGANNVCLIEKGLGERRQKSSYEFRFDGNLGGSRFLPAGDVSETGGTRHMELEIVPGDELFADKPISSIGFVKIDVEGFESRVIAGMKQLIGLHKPVIMFESHPEENLDEAQRMIISLKELGYRHFYACEMEPNPFPDLLRKLFFRITRGVKVQAQEIVALEPREYLVIIATVDACLGSSKPS